VTALLGSIIAIFSHQVYPIFMPLSHDEISTVIFVSNLKTLNPLTGKLPN